MKNPTTKPTDDWRSDYCKQFGLCKAGGKCQCKKELDFIEKAIKSARQQAYTEGVMKALEVLEKLHGTKDNFFVDESCGHCDGHPPCEIEIGIEEARAAIKALLP